MAEAERVQLRPNSIDAAYAARPSKPIVIVPNSVSPIRPTRTIDCEVRPQAPVATETVASEDPLVKEFVAAALAIDESRIKAFVDEQLGQGISVQSIYLDLLAPAARMLGDMWAEDSCDFVEPRFVVIGVGRCDGNAIIGGIHRQNIKSCCIGG